LGTQQIVNNFKCVIVVFMPITDLNFAKCDLWQSHLYWRIRLPLNPPGFLSCIRRSISREGVRK
jgi:hypothetical protein